jgi:hypothetical protein
MYRIIQSFKPEEISPEDANRLGYELAMKFTEGKHQFVVSTHVDKGHIHTHIEFNSTNLNCDGKFLNPKDSYLILRQLNDELCRAHGFSVIENPKPTAREQKQREMEAAKHGRSHKERLRQTIDRVLPDCRDYDDFLEKMRAEGYEVKEGKTLSFRAPGWDRFTRSNKLGADYTRACGSAVPTGAGDLQRRKGPFPTLAGRSTCSLTFKRRWRLAKVRGMSVGRRFLISKRPLKPSISWLRTT